MPDLVPSSFSALVHGREPEPSLGGDAWLARLPGLVDESLADWDLSLDGDPMHGVCALVLPVRRRDGSAAVLKLTWPHLEARHEHLALQRWAGFGAVRQLATNPSRWTMLLERLNSNLDLSDVPTDEACTVIGALLRQLDRDALPQLSRLSARATTLADKLRSAPGAMPRRFARQAGSLLSDLMTEEAIDSRLVNTDLHYRNVLAADRQPWLVIDCGRSRTMTWTGSRRPSRSSGRYSRADLCWQPQIQATQKASRQKDDDGLMTRYRGRRPI